MIKIEKKLHKKTHKLHRNDIKNYIRQITIS